MENALLSLWDFFKPWPNGRHWQLRWMKWLLTVGILAMYALCGILGAGTVVGFVWFWETFYKVQNLGWLVPSMVLGMLYVGTLLVRMTRYLWKGVIFMGDKAGVIDLELRTS
jgi:hypothetical protein